MYFRPRLARVLHVLARAAGLSSSLPSRQLMVVRIGCLPYEGATWLANSFVDCEFSVK